MTTDTRADGEGGWADVQHTDPFFSLPTPNPADGALAEALAELRDETTQRWNALDFNGFADPYAGHIATILNAALSGALIPRPAEPHSRPETLAQIEERICSCGAGHGSGEGHTGWCDFTDYQALPPRPAEPAQAAQVDPLLRLHSVARIIWDAMIWSASQKPPAHGAAFPSYMEWGNSDAEHRARNAALGVIVLIAAAQEGRE